MVKKASDGRFLAYPLNQFQFQFHNFKIPQHTTPNDKIKYN